MPDSFGELTPGDVAAFTKGRLAADDPLTATLLAMTLADARSFCGWHVTPVRTSAMVTLDGPGSGLLVLPTLRMTALISVVEDGTEVDLSTLAWSTRGLVRKRSGARWSGQFGSIDVEFTHGFTEADAAGWTRAVLSAVDRNARIASNEPIVVGPFRWSDTQAVEGSAFTAAERAALEPYRLERPA